MSDDARPETRCPVPHGDRRRTAPPGERSVPRVEVLDGVWHVRSLPMVRQVLREADGTVQAGFSAETARQGLTGDHPPVLYADGPEHRRQRTATARFFTPAAVSRRYRALMEERADELVERIRQDGGAELSAITLRYSVEVAAQVVGLTNSDIDGMSRRLERFFSGPVTGSAGSPRRRLPARLGAVAGALRPMWAMTAFQLRDVRPAIRARRREPQEDVVSHLLAEDYTDREILVECLTYAAAGMATTREFIAVAAWHLLEDDRLREEYLAADEPARHGILHEILRLEPVVGHLYRRTTRELVLEDGDERHEVPVGALLDLYVRQANTDEQALGEDARQLCPDRSRPRGIRPEAMSFGDGAHRCPGGFLAIQETDVFLQRLLRLPLEFAHPPRVSWVELIAAYEVRDVVLRVGAGQGWRTPSPASTAR
ncbi:cytochrome P450 [Kocuria sp. WN036]|uniref:cytochrome P450 n=1 Tax=Kocuria sp. WN036 TaxID=2032628 RepID=UPI000BAB8498|nr:cytochrome P450 [Kocuria sp. WN036]PAU91628.1 cytochrome P450 [Kocuria sp. WN036]